MRPETRAERQAEFKRIDAWLERMYQGHRFWFNVIGFAVAVLICGLGWGLWEMLRWVAGLL